MRSISHRNPERRRWRWRKRASPRLRFRTSRRSFPSPAEPEAPDFGLPYVEAAIQLRKGDTVARVLDRLGISAADGAEIVAALARHVRLDRLPIGQALLLKLQRLEAEEATLLVGLSIRTEPHRAFTLERGEDGDYSVEEEVFAVTPRLQRAAGMVEGSVIGSAEAAGVPHGRWRKCCALSRGT